MSAELTLSPAPANVPSDAGLLCSVASLLAAVPGPFVGPRLSTLVEYVCATYCPSDACARAQRLELELAEYLHGGITGCRKIADYAALTRTPMGMHSGPCSLIRWYASMHLGAAVENFFKVENVLGAFRGYKEKMAQGSEPAVRKSVFPVPEGPGLGIEINQDWLRSHLAKGETWWG